MEKGNGKQGTRQTLVVVAKAPLMGNVKTRLCPYLTPAEAASFYECLLKDIVSKMGGFQRGELWIAFAPEGEEYFRRNFMKDRLLTQRGKDLGQRLHSIFVDLFHMGYRQIIVADSDSPTVPLSSINQAFDRLNEANCDGVLGPSSDGGYYLIGLKRPTARLFHDIPWSTEGVLKSTLARANELGLKVAMLPTAYDIDVEGDLKRLWSDLETCRPLQKQVPKTYAFLTRLLAGRSSEEKVKDAIYPLPEKREIREVDS
jgi:rSAM/selenodomain-associated transferase 1